ncbi:unnamed protein product, partial [Effrenium voratum]
MKSRFIFTQVWVFFLLRLRVSTGATTCASREPLVWKIEQGKRFAYIAGISHIPSSKTPPLEGGPLAEALSCCDVAYFPTGCSLADKSNVTGVGHYMSHCSYYPVLRQKDTIAERLAPQTLTDLQGALDKLVQYAPPACKSTAAEFQASVQNLNSTDYRLTLLSVFHRGLEAINPLWCVDPGAKTLDTYLRQEWGQRKPIFGLEDIAVECQAFQGHDVEQDQDLARYMASHFTDEWLTQKSNLEEGMEEVMKCGDLTNLRKLVDHMKDLPLRSVADLQQR